jgi:hypothetical protein
MLPKSFRDVRFGGSRLRTSAGLNPYSRRRPKLPVGELGGHFDHDGRLRNYGENRGQLPSELLYTIAPPAEDGEYPVAGRCPAGTATYHPRSPEAQNHRSLIKEAV